MGSDKVIIRGSELLENKELKISFTFKNEEQILVKGFVLNPLNEPLKNAAIEIRVYDKSQSDAIEIFIGLTFSLEDGSYGIAVPYKGSYEYKFAVYSS